MSDDAIGADGFALDMNMLPKPLNVLRELLFGCSSLVGCSMLVNDGRLFASSTSLCGGKRKFEVRFPSRNCGLVGRLFSTVAPETLFRRGIFGIFGLCDRLLVMSIVLMLRLDEFMLGLTLLGPSIC